MPDIFKNITVTAVIAAVLLVLVFAVARSDKLKVWRAAAYRPRTKKACAKSLTLRISNIPRNITEGELKHMVDLAGEVNASPGAAVAGLVTHAFRTFRAVLCCDRHGSCTSSTKPA
jgi:hypothetical protein